MLTSNLLHALTRIFLKKSRNVSIDGKIALERTQRGIRTSKQDFKIRRKELYMLEGNLRTTMLETLLTI